MTDGNWLVQDANRDGGNQENEGTLKQPTFVVSPNIIRYVGCGHSYKKAAMSLGGGLSVEISEVKWRKNEPGFDAVVLRRTSMVKGKMREWNFVVPLHSFQNLWDFWHIVNAGTHPAPSPADLAKYVTK